MSKRCLGEKKKLPDITGESGEGDELAGPSTQTVCSGCNYLIILMEALKEKCALTKSRRENFQFQLRFLQVGQYSLLHKNLRQANIWLKKKKNSRELRNSKGILPKPEIKPGTKLSEEVKQAVMDFNQRDNINHMCPAKKD